MLKILIATPTADGRTPIGYVQSIVRAVAVLERGEVETSFVAPRHYDIVQQRNTIASHFLETDCSHIWFVDSDMMFEPDIALKLLSFRQPLIGVAYMRRELNLTKML